MDDFEAALARATDRHDEEFPDDIDLEGYDYRDEDWDR